MRRALGLWAVDAATTHPELLAVGLFGSYARGDWGVGSDADVVLLVDRAHRPFLERPRDWDMQCLPVPADLLVYEAGEWEDLARRENRFAIAMRREALWLWRRPPFEAGAQPLA